MMLKINGEIWKLCFVSPNDLVLYLDNGIYTYGVTIPGLRRIYIANNITGDFLKHVIAHEIAHAEFASRGLIIPIYTEEVLADIIADNILDSYIQMNNVCRYYGKC